MSIRRISPQQTTMVSVGWWSPNEISMPQSSKFVSQGLSNAIVTVKKRKLQSIPAKFGHFFCTLTRLGTKLSVLEHFADLVLDRLFYSVNAPKQRTTLTVGERMDSAFWLGYGTLSSCLAAGGRRGVGGFSRHKYASVPPAHHCKPFCGSLKSVIRSIE